MTTSTDLRAGTGTDIVEGRVKWFDPECGFGFIQSDRLDRDVLLHANVLRSFGQSSIASDRAVTVRVRHGARGLHAVELLAVEAPSAPEPDAAGAPLPEYLQPVDDALPYLPVRVKWFDRRKGFGFANAFDRDGDIFIHAEVLRRSGFDDLQTGEAICLRAVEGTQGPIALEVHRWGMPGRHAA